MRIRVIVVGGGITGLAAAWTLSKSGIETVLLEASERLGGKLLTIDIDGVQMEAGADSFVVRGEDLPDWCVELGIQNELVEPAVFGGLVWRAGRMQPLPKGTVMGIPTSPTVALKAAPLGPLGRLRALGDLVLPGPLRGPDVSVGDFVRKRFGNQVLERMVDPILAGTRAGRPDEMSLTAALPDVDAAARSRRSLIRGRSPGTPPRFFAPSSGMSRIVDAIRARLNTVEVRTSTPVTAVARKGADYVVISGDEVFTAPAVIVCLPAHLCADLIQPIAPEAATGLRTIEHASVASIAFTFDQRVSLPPASSGVLIPSSEDRTLSAATWWSVKWPHTSTDAFALRCFVGRAGRHPALELDDDALAKEAIDELTELIGPLPPLRSSAVTRWDKGMPQYRVGHIDTVRRIYEALRESPGVRIAGADLEGSGIADCWRQGATAAGSIGAFVAASAR